MDVLHYRAGARALQRLRQRGGLSAGDIGAIVLPAIGPKWLALYGIDRALIDAGWLGPAQPTRRPLLFGASAGAWRSLAWCARDPGRAIDALCEAYCLQHFTREDSPAAISGAYRRLLHSVVGPEDLAHAAAHPRFDLAIATVRARGPLAIARRRHAQGAALAAATLLNALGSRTQRWFFERVVFSTSAGASAEHPLVKAAPGRVLSLTPDNMLDAALASGSVPLYMQAVRDIAEAPRGQYLDGGFSDYHLNRPVRGDGLTVLFLHQRRVVPTWTDKFLPWRRLARAATQDLLLVHPSEAFVRALPGGQVPTRHDFERLLHQPQVRAERWREVAQQSRVLGEALLRDAESGAIVAKARAL